MARHPRMTAATTAASRLSAFGVRTLYSPKCLEVEFSEVRKDHSFGACAPVPLGNTIRSLLSRVLLIPLRGTAGFSLAYPRSYAAGWSYVQISGIVAYIRNIIPAGVCS